MPNVFLTSDTHFGHVNICKFTNYDGSPVRPWDSVEEMDEEILRKHTSGTHPNDFHMFLELRDMFLTNITMIYQMYSGL